MGGEIAVVQHADKRILTGPMQTWLIIAAAIWTAAP
jgi:hypothetical protein